MRPTGNGSKGLPATPEALRAYAQRVLRPGQVQSFGCVILVASEASYAVTGAEPGVVLGVSENAESLLGVHPDALVDHNLFDPVSSPFAPACVSKLERALSADGDLAAKAPLIVSLRSNESVKLYAIAHTTEEGHVVDLEPIDEGSDRMLEGAIRSQSLAKVSVTRIQDAAESPSSELTRLVVDELRKLLGYDRCMMYRFHEDQHGEVVAESYSKYASDAFEGLHFPATDIPQANRAIFMSMRSRMIADVAAAASKVRRSARMRDDILLGGSQLRGVSGCHGQYLGNMGVKATLVMSVIVAARDATDAKKTTEKLWGLVVCHHYQGPRRVPYYQRSAAEFLVRVFALQLGRTVERERRERERALRSARDVVVSCLKYVEEVGCRPEHLAQTLGSVVCTEPTSAALPMVAKATGAALVMGDAVLRVGKCPAAEDVVALAAWVAGADAEVSNLADGASALSTQRRRLVAGGTWHTDSLLREGFDRAESVREVASGVMVADATPATVSSYDGGAGFVVRDSSTGSLASVSDAGGATVGAEPVTLVWFRGERLKEESWAGGKRAAPARHKGVEMAPRESFAAVKEVLRGESEPWSSEELASASDTRVLVRDVVRACRRGRFTNRAQSSLDAVVGAFGDDDGHFAGVADELRTIVGTADLPMIKLDPAMRITEHNNFAATLLAGSGRSVVGENLEDFLQRDSRDAVADEYRAAVRETRAPRPTLLKFKPRGGEEGIDGRGGGEGSAEGSAEHHADEFASGTGGGSGGERAYRAMLAFPQFKRDPGGEPAGLVLTGRDLGSFRATMHALAVADPNDDVEIRAVVSGAIVPVASVDAGGRVEDWNALMEFATGATAADAEGKLLLGELFGDEKSTRAPLTVFATTNAPDPMTELAARLSVVISGETDKNEDEDDAESESGSKSMSFDDAFTESVRDNASARFAHAKSPTGPGAPDSRQMDVILFFARRPGARGGAFVFLLDTRLPRVIERAMAVQLASETAAQAKSRHIAFVSHEIRNPVNGILASVEAIDELIPVMRAFGSSKVIPNGSGTGDGAASLDEMHDLVRSTLACTDQLRRTVDGMLDLNKLEEGKMTLRESPFDVDLMVRAVTMQIKSAMEKKDLHLASEVSPLLRGVRLVGDAPKIQQVLANFCWNAVKFTSEGSVTLDVTCEMPEEGGDAPVSVFFKVIDTGEGMSKSTMERVFDRFAMGEHKVSKYGGSGLGLAICRSLAELMHGEIHCMSQPGRGSTFVLELAMLIDRSSRSSESRSADHFGEPSGTDGPPDSPESSVETGLALEGLRDAPGPSKLSRVDSNPLPAVPVPDQTSTTPTTATAAPIPTPTADASALEEKSRGVGVPRQFSRQSFVVKRDGNAIPYTPPAPATSPVPASAPSPALSPGSTFRSPHDGFFARARDADAAARASGGHHAFQNPSVSGSTLVPSSFDAVAPPASPSAWSVTAIREHVAVTSVAVLVEVRAGDEVRQHWGGSPVGPAGVGPALADAQRDGMERALALFRPESGIPSPTPVRLGWNGNVAVDASHPRVAPPPTPPAPTPPAPSEASAASLSARFDAQVSTRDVGRNADAAAVDAIENGSHPRPFANASAPPACDSVLIVDDDKVNVKVLHRAFSKGSFGTVTTGEDGQDAVQLLINQDAKFDVVLIDENMRHMNGTVATERVRAREAQNGCSGRQLVVVTSGNSSYSDKIKYQKAGMNAMLVKPMNLKGVVRWVQDYHAFFTHTRAAGGWKPGQPLPDWCPKPEFKPESTFEDGYFFGDVEVFGSIPRQ